MEPITPIYNPERSEHDEKTASDIIILLTPTALNEAARQVIADTWYNIPRWYDASEEACKLLTEADNTPEYALSVLQQILDLVPDGGCAIVYGTVLTPIFRREMRWHSVNAHANCRTILAHESSALPGDNALPGQWIPIGYFHYRFTDGQMWIREGSGQLMGGK